jgi:hypothetical protein
MPSANSLDSQQTTWSKKLCLLLLGMLVGLLFVEAGLRVFGLHFQSSCQAPDRTLGWSLQPNSVCWNGEGETDFAVNSVGFHDRERLVKKPPNTYRVAVLGDSFVESAQAPVAETFLAQIEQELPGCPALGGRGVEILNFGVSGYGQAQELLMLRTRVWQYEPDMVILSVYFGNDLFDNYRALDLIPPGMRPYFVYRGDRLVPDDSFRESPSLNPWRIRLRNFLVGVLSYSRLVLFLNTVRFAIRNPYTKSMKHNAIGGVPANYATIWPYLPPSHPHHQEAWRVTEGLVLEIAHEVKANGAGFLVVTMPMARQVDPDPDTRLAFQKELGVDSLYYSDERLRALVGRNEIALVPLYGPLGVEAEREHEYVTGGKDAVQGEGHLNRIGGRVVAEVLKRYLCEHFEQ